MIGTFYNKMPFSIKMRKTWEAGAPAIELLSGGLIEGPVEILSQFKVLAPLPSDFCEVDSVTQTQQFSFVDNKETPVESNKLDEAPASTPKPVADLTKLPFNPHDAKWLYIKVSELEEACRILGVDMAPVSTLKPKDKKWALVKLVKIAVGMDVK
jgi:hypothetical protein